MSLVPRPFSPNSHPRLQILTVMSSSSQIQRRQRALFVNGPSQKSLPGNHGRLPLMDTSNRRVSHADPRGSSMQYKSAGHYEGSDREETRDDSPTPPAARSNTHKRGAPRSGLSDEENTPQNTKQVVSHS
jgi:hypothetical protein